MKLAGWLVAILSGLGVPFFAALITGLGPPVMAAAAVAVAIWSWERGKVWGSWSEGQRTVAVFIGFAGSWWIFSKMLHWVHGSAWSMLID